MSRNKTGARIRISYNLWEPYNDGTWMILEALNERAFILMGCGKAIIGRHKNCLS
jgi:hypothetical protein